MSKFQLAGAAESLRASQKDEHYIRYMKNLVAELTQRSLGVHYWLNWRQSYDLVSGALYYFLTTLSGFQTLGEEYVHIIQVDSSLRILPSLQRHILNIALRVFGPFLLLRLQKYLEKKLEDTAFVKESMCSKNGNSHKKFLKLLPVIFRCITYIQRLHLVAFYFHGTYYHFSKRITGIKYVMLRRWLGLSSSQTPYKMLGYITASQLCISLAIDIYAFYVKKFSGEAVDKFSRKPELVDYEVSVKDHCSLCLEKRQSSTLTPCGHLFCWTCITGWMQTKEECPLCREKFIPSRLLCLQNYR